MARDELTMLQSREPGDWRWGQLHQLELVNPTLGDSGVGLVNSLFNRGPFDLGGGGGIVDATSWDATEGYEVTAVPVDAHGRRPRQTSTGRAGSS